MEGYWLNIRSGAFFEIDEHARWISNAENARRIGLSMARHARIAALRWDRDRLKILLIAMGGSLMRIRRHRDHIAFEHTAEQESALDAVGKFLEKTELAGDVAILRIGNIKLRKTIELTYADFKAPSVEGGISRSTAAVQAVSCEMKNSQTATVSDSCRVGRKEAERVGEPVLYPPELLGNASAYSSILPIGPVKIKLFSLSPRRLSAGFPPERW